MPSGQPKNIVTQTKQDTAPWQPLQPHVLGMAKAATDAFKATNKNPFLGDFIATPGADFTQGIDLLRGAATSGNIGAGAQDVQDLALSTLRGDYMRPESNPFLASAGEAATRPIMQNFQNTILPAITDQAIAQGAYGGSGQDVSQERATGQVGTAIGDTLAKMYYQNYATERQNQLNAPGMLAQSYDFFNMPGQNMLQLAGLEQAGRQQVIDNELRKFQEQKSAPWYGLGELAQILTAGGFRSTTGTETKPNPNYVDPFTNALKIGLGAASTIAGIGGGGGFGFWGK